MTTDPSSFVGDRLAESHELSSFDCGHPVLNEWLRASARHADAMGTGRTYVWTAAGPDVLAYYTLAPHVVSKPQAPRRLARGLPDVIPSILVARLALVERFQGRGWGSALLMDALHRSAETMRRVGGSLIVVDAIDEGAAGFYEHHGFVRPQNQLRLFRMASDVARSFGIP